MLKLLLHYHLKLAEACQQHQFADGGAALVRSRTSDALENATNCIATVGKTGEDGENGILQMWTFEKVFGGNIPYVKDSSGI